MLKVTQITIQNFFFYGPSNETLKILASSDLPADNIDNTVISYFFHSLLGSWEQIESKRAGCGWKGWRRGKGIPRGTRN